MAGPTMPTSPRPAVSEPVFSRQALNLPNLISFLRLLGVPVFLYLLLVADRPVAALVVLAVGGTTDWLDGWVARRLGQVSRLGELLDPMADRLYILATLFAFTVSGIVPWQFAAALVARELIMVGVLGVLRWHSLGPPPVHYLGKTATFILLAAFPVLLLAAAVPGAAGWADPTGWALAWWGMVLYWAAAGLYVAQAASLVRRRGGGETGGATAGGPVG